MRGRWIAGLALGAALAGCGPRPVTPPVEAIAVTAGAGGTVVVTSRGPDTRTWLLDDEGGLVEPLTTRPPTGPARTADCAGEVCYRVVPGELRVEESGDGGDSYVTVWRISGVVYDELAAGYRDLGDPAIHLSSRSVAVRAVPGGHIVFVANGRDGLLHRDVAGRWHRIGMPDCAEGCYLVEPPRLAIDPVPPDPTPYLASLGVLAVLLAGGIAAAVRHSLRPGNAAAIAALAAVAGLVGGLAAHFPDVGMFPGIYYGSGFFAFGVALLGTVAALLGARRAPAPPPVRAP